MFPLHNSNTHEPSQEQLQSLINLYEKDQYQETLNEAIKSLTKFPNSINLYNIIGAANKSLGKLEEALEAYIKAISINPDYADAYHNMGVVLHDQDKLEEAIQAYTKALCINPEYTSAYNNMGNALKDQGKLEDAIEAYSKALSINPDYADAYNNMGVALKNQGKLEDAIEAYSKALSIQPDYANAYNNMGIALKGVIFSMPNGDLQKKIISLLDKKSFVRPTDIAKAVISLLKLELTIQKHLQLGDDEIIQHYLGIITDLNKFHLLLKLMSVCPIPDLEIEVLLTNLRHSILVNISFLQKESSELIQFQSALALQCFTNEYIYNCTDEEEKILRSLEASVEKTLEQDEQPNPQIILGLASYKALNEYDWCKLLVVTDHIKDVFDRQVEEPNQEQKLKQELPVLEEINDTVSSKVREQYEESPYPRWINLELPLRPMSISNVINQSKLKLHHNKITEVDKPEILIAGCGTGQHSIGTAARFKSSKVLAIDLSLSSLAYAKRKSEELAVGNIEYMQADILNLGQLNKQFDIIESVGVLHHMDNPMAGWKVLTDCLKPGGLMRIGLYSELARKHIVKIREEIRKAGIGSRDATMKSFRTRVIGSYQNHHQTILKSPDFYSLSTLKDLLFHVQEHRFTIPQIKGHLDAIGLKFCGIETTKIVSHFKQTNTLDNDPYDLDKWHTYELVNPKTFAGMYQFWCQKVD